MKTVLVPLADGCEEMEAITITDILTRAGAKVVTAGLHEGLITASRGARLMPDTTLDQLRGQTFDLIALPGGLPGADYLADDVNLHIMLRQQLADNKLVAAVCAAPKALAAAGVINNRRITHYPGALDSLDGSWVATDKAVEIDGPVVTGRGPGVALDFALALVEQLFDRATRDQVEGALVR